LLLNQPLLYIQFAYVNLLQIECEDDWQRAHQVPFECGFKLEWNN